MTHSCRLAPKSTLYAARQPDKPLTELTVGPGRSLGGELSVASSPPEGCPPHPSSLPRAEVCWHTAILRI
ncbi:hypothetical protein LZ31DRAFT_548316 [Colletotrichum somersetense]|nr:hypothetical protein LZ31DRAFT_548316 [Colletotrichum somersetense]